MKNHEEIISKFEIECSCGHAELEFSQWKDDGISFQTLTGFLFCDILYLFEGVPELEYILDAKPSRTN